MIAKDKRDVIVRALDSTHAVFDLYCLQDTGSTDGTQEVFVAWCVKNNKPYKISSKYIGTDYESVLVDGHEVLADFAKARNDSFSLVEDCKYAFWMDTDDILQDPEQVLLLADFADNNKIDQIIMPYDYAGAGNDLSAVDQQRERLINLQKKGHWVNFVHEHYEYLEPAKAYFSSQVGATMQVVHKRTHIESANTNRRNNLIMIRQLEKEGLENFSNEMLSHLAYDHWEHHEFDESLKYYKILVDRYEATRMPAEATMPVVMKLSQIHFSRKEYDEASKWAIQATALSPNMPDGFLMLAQIYAEIGSWANVETYVDKVLAIGRPETTAPINEYDLIVTPRLMKIQCLLNRNDIDNAIKVAEQLVAMAPGNAMLRQKYFDVKRYATMLKAKIGLSDLALWFQENNKGAKLKKLVKAIPFEFLDDDMVRMRVKELLSDYTRKAEKTTFKGPKTILIYAGQGYEDWDGDSDVAKGIGGSEGMCIQLSRELAKLGNKVFVYNSCGQSDGKDFDGVTYIDHRKWSSDIRSDIFISLRRPDVFNRLINAKQTYLWLHDTEYGNVPLTNLYSPNKVFVLTNFHKDIIKQNQGITDDSIFQVTRNGLNSAAVEFAEEMAAPRNLKQVIYGSSYDRGLEFALDVWPEVLKEVPDARLIICYGFDTMDSMIRMAQQNGDIRRAQYLSAFKAKLLDKINKTPNVFELGRLSQNEVYKKFRESGFWFYPTEFQEISCITGMTAQAMGAIPVCTPVAALNETVNGKYGIKLERDKIVQGLIYALKNPAEMNRKRKAMMQWASQAFSMKDLAKEWDEIFNNG